ARLRPTLLSRSTPVRFAPAAFLVLAERVQSGHCANPAPPRQSKWYELRTGPRDRYSVLDRVSRSVRTGPCRPGGRQVDWRQERSSEGTIQRSGSYGDAASWFRVGSVRQRQDGDSRRRGDVLGSYPR